MIARVILALLLLEAPAFATNTLYRRAMWPSSEPTPTPTPTPRPTSIVLAGANNAACGVNDRYFGNGNACNATEANVDVPTSEAGTFTDMACSQPTDATCTISFQLRRNASDVASFYCESVNTAACSPSSPTPTSFANGALLAVKVTDVDGNCGSNAPTCTVFYTVP